MAGYDRLLKRDPLRSRYDLARIGALVEAAGHPERAYPTVLVAGTNGKGSVTAVVERALRAAGFRTGRYTSPHLVRPEERIAIDGVPVAADTFEAAIAAFEGTEARCLAAGTLTDPATFFEAMTAIAFDVLRQARVEIGLIEVGLGGRLDATNVCDPVATAIVSIDLDHQALLGETRAAIAAEKAGIARAGVPLVVGDLSDDALDAVVGVAGAAGARLVYAAEGVECVVRDVADGHLTITLDTATRTYGPVRLALGGAHQAANAFVAVALLESLDDAGFHVGRAAVETGLSAACWPGRLDLVTLDGGRTLLLDAAHNPSGARALAAHVAALSRGAARPPLVFAASKDKDAEAMIRALASSVGDIVVTAFGGERGEPAEVLAGRVRAALEASDGGARRIHVATSPADALALAWTLSPHVIVAGSIFLLGEVYPLVGRADPFAGAGTEARTAG